MHELHFVFFVCFVIPLQGRLKFIETAAQKS